MKYKEMYSLPDASHFRALRAYFKITQIDLAKEINVSRNAILALESGKDVYYSVIVKLNDYFNNLMKNGNKTV